MKNRFKKAFALFVMSVCAFTDVSLGQGDGGGSISINFGCNNSSGTAVDYYSLTTGTNYGVVPVLGENWNVQSGANSGNPSGSGIALKDNTGAATTAVLDWKSSCFWYVSKETPTSDSGRLFWSYLDDGNATVSVSNIPYEIYDLVFINSTDSANSSFSAVSVNKQKYTSLNGQTTVGANNWGSTNSARGTDSELSLGQNYLYIDGLTGALSIVHGGNNGARGTISALQIVNALPNGYDWQTSAVASDGSAVLPQASYSGLKLVRDASGGTTITPSQAATVDILKIQDATGASAVTLGGTFQFSGDHKWLYAGSVSNSTVLTVNSAITATDNSFTLFANGEVDANASSAGRTLLNSNYSGSLRLGSGLTDVQSTGLTTASSVVLDGGGIYFSANDSLAKDLKVADGGALRVSSGTATYSGAIVEETAGTAGNIRKIGAGTLNLTGSVRITGDICVEKGTLNVSAGVLDNSQTGLSLSEGTINIGSVSNNSGNVNKLAGTININGPLTNYSGTFTQQSGTTTIAETAPVVNLTGSLNNWGVATLNVNGSIEINGTGLVSTWGKSGNSGTTNLPGAITGTGTITTEDYGVTNISGSLAGFTGTISNTQSRAQTNITSSDLAAFGGTLVVSNGNMILGTNTTAIPDLSGLTGTVSGSGVLTIAYSGDYTARFPNVTGTGTIALGSETAGTETQTIKIDENSFTNIGTVRAQNAQVVLSGTEILYNFAAGAGGSFRLESGNLISASKDVSINANISPASGTDIVYQPNGNTISLGAAATMTGIGNIAVSGPGTLALADSLKEFSGNVTIDRGALKLSGSVSVLPASATVTLGDFPAGETVYGTRGALLASGSAEQAAASVVQKSKSGLIRLQSGQLTVADLSRTAGATTVLRNDTSTAAYLAVHAGAGFSLAGDAASQIVPGVYYWKGTGNTAGRAATIDAEGNLTAYADDNSAAVYKITDNSWAAADVENKNVINAASKKGELATDITLTSLTTHGDFWITAGSTTTLSGGTLILQSGCHWIQGKSDTDAGRITSSYSSDGGTSVDLYVFTAGHTWKEELSDIRNFKAGQIAVNSVKISDNGTQKLNLILDGAGGRGNTFQLMKSAGAYTGYTQVRSGTLVLNSGTVASSEFQILNGGGLAVMSNPANQKYTVAEGGTLTLFANTTGAQISGVNGLGGTINFDHDETYNSNTKILSFASRSYTPTFVDGANVTFDAINIDQLGTEAGYTTVNFQGNQTLNTKSFSTAGTVNLTNFTLNADLISQTGGSINLNAGANVNADSFVQTGGVLTISDAAKFKVKSMRQTGTTIHFTTPASVSVDGDLNLDSAIVQIDFNAAMAGYLTVNPLYDVTGTASIVNTTLQLDFSENPNLVLGSVYELALVGGGEPTLTNTVLEIANWQNAWGDPRALLETAALGEGTTGVYVRLTDGAHVPEPATWVLLAIGLFGLGWIRQRGKSNTEAK